MRAFLGVYALVSFVACSERVEVGSDVLGAGRAGTAGASGGVGAEGGRAGSEGSGGAGPSAGSGACEPAECLGKTYLCGNCSDDDEDGLVDALDADCLGPCDNTEDSYYGGIPGQNNAPCRQDCYFDRDTGSGNDGCTWSQACDVHSVPPDYPPSGNATCEYDPTNTLSGQACTDPQPDACQSYCLPLTPNGCDCFGCCELPARSGRYVWIGSNSSGSGTCDAEHVDDPNSCRPCTPVRSCLNRCDACEVCVGTTTPGPGCGTSVECGPGGRACSALRGCNADEYCITGCCVPVPR